MTDTNDYHLGEVAARYESTGPGAVSTGAGDKGGISYGTYQLSSNEGTLADYLKQSAYKSQFDGLTPESTAFNEKWRELGRTDPGFAQDQQGFIKKSHFDPAVSTLKKDGLDLTGRGPAVQEALWSTSVQTRGLTPRIFEHGLKEKFGKGYKLSDLSDKDIVGAVQDYKIAHTHSLFKSSPSLWHNLIDRAGKEKEDLVALADGKTLPERGSARHATDKADAIVKEHANGAAVLKFQGELAELGYTDAKGRPPHADGHFGPATESAVRAFQADHGLTQDGKVGPATQQAIQAGLQPLKRDDPGLLPAVFAMSSLPAGTPGLDDPRNALNPNHALFNDLKERIPQASEQRLLQFTAICHENGITDKNLGAMRLDEEGGFMHFGSNGLIVRTASVDIKERSPQPAQSIQHIQQTDQHQVQIQTQIQAQIQAQNAQAPQGPVLGGPSMPSGR